MRVFLSHSSKDKPQVRKLAQQLKLYGIDIWIDEERIYVGDSISKKIQQGLRESDYLCIWLTNQAMQSGWVEKEWLPKIKQEIDESRTVVLPLLAENCDLPDFLIDKRYADFRSSFNDGLDDLLQVFDIKKTKTIKKVTHYVYDLLSDLDGVIIPLPHITNINIISSLKKIPRSGKKIRLDTYEPKVEIRSIYDHLISVAHSADCLLPELGLQLSDTEAMDLSRCIVYHDICEIFLGDIHQYTPLTDPKRSKASILAEERLKRFSPQERDSITNAFIKLFLEEREQLSMTRYESIIHKNNELSKLFIFLDKIDPLIGVWRYLFYYRGKLDDGKKFISRLRDFFIYERPIKVAQEYSNDPRVICMIERLRDRHDALNYYQGQGLQGMLFGFHSSIITQLIEGHTMQFAPTKKKNRKEQL